MKRTLSPNSRKRAPRALRHLEMLEPRTLLSATITSYPTGLAIGGAAYDSNGALWVYNVNNSSLDQIVDKAVVKSIALDANTCAPVAFAGGANGHIFAADAFGAIDDIDTATATTGTTTITQTILPNTTESPTAITVTGNGDVWFLGFGNYTSNTHTNVIGLMDHVTHSVTTYETDASVQDSVATIISASGADSVWIGMGALEVLATPNILGTNRVAYASFDGTNISLNPYVVDNANLINGLAADPDGSVWFTLSNTTDTTTHPLNSPDQLVHGVINGNNLVQTTFTAGNAGPDTSLNYGALALDVQGNVWFVEFNGNQIGSFDGAAFTLYDNPTTGTFVQTLANADGTQLSILTTTDDPVDDWPIIQIDVSAAAVTFSGSANDLSDVEHFTFNNTLLATFTAPTPAGVYSATITWGDGTSTVVAPTDLGANSYAISISGKAFANQGTFNGSIAIHDGTTAVGTLAFTSTIGDIPLNVTSITASPLIFRIVTAVGTFTDDGDLALATWKATINWGDSTSSTGLIVRDPSQSGRYVVLALHQYRARGTYTVRLSVATTELNAAVTRSTLTTTVTAR